MLREYFTDLFPYMREAVPNFSLERIWDKVYADVITDDFELDRLALFLNRLYNEDKELFASFPRYVMKELVEKFHEPKENFSRVLQELGDLDFIWNGKKLTHSLA